MSDDRPNPAEHNRFEKALARGLEDQPPPSSGPCPNAEALAAFSEDSLPTPDRQALESHLAACGNCQAHMAALIRTEASEEPTTQRAASWWLDWRWLTPVATTAVVLLAVWVVDPTSVRDSGIEQEEAATVALRTDDSGDVPESTVATRQERATDDEAADPPALREQASTAEADATRVADAAKIADAAQTPEEADPPPTVATASRNTLSASPPAESTDALSPAPLAERRLDDLTQLSPTSSPLRSRMSPQSAALVVRASDQTAAWRATPQGGVEHSTDGGITWTLQLETAGAALTAGSAPSGSICWMVGRDATILRTVDGGASWSKIEAPLQSDIVGVSATDGQTVMVEFSRGQAFISSDGGSTWTAQ